MVMSDRAALRVGDTVLQLTDAVAVREAGTGQVWFVTPSIAVRAQMTLDEALKLLDWTVVKTARPG